MAGGVLRMCTVVLDNLRAHRGYGTPVQRPHLPEIAQQISRLAPRFTQGANCWITPFAARITRGAPKPPHLLARRRLGLCFL
jgi:hypothetical protein